MNKKTMPAIMDAQRKAFLGDGFLSSKTRIDRIDRVKDIHVRYKRRFECTACDHEEEKHP
jgi:hypothetical protein